jgi:hypothetical protein
MNKFTISKFRYPKHLEDTFDNYTFYYEHDKIYQEFFVEHPIPQLSYELFNKINNAVIKKFCFSLYVLFIKGGFFIDLNVIPGKDLNNFELEKNTFYCVESILKNDTLFLGVFGSFKENYFLLELINRIIELDNHNSNISSKNIYELIKQIKVSNVVYLNEKLLHPNCVSTVTESNLNLFDHYHDPNISYTIPFQHQKINHVKDVKIGITLLLLNDVKSFFSNGINQNSLYLCELLLNIGYDAYFIVEDPKLMNINKEMLDNILYDKRFKLKKYSEILYSEFNVIITLSFSYGDLFIYNYLKHMNTKHVGYFCGNTYIIETEKILYNQHKIRQNDAYDFTINGLSKYDEIWSIPQMAGTNLDFWSILYKCKCIEVPFVWSNNAIKLFCKANSCKEEDLYYINKGPDKKITIFEPNISIMKWALPSILITESTYRNNKHLKHLYITNINSSSTTDFNLDQFNKFMTKLDIVKDKKCSIETRHTTLSFMSNYADIAVSHQWGNPLNYLYFDLAWMGWPVVHNAYLCKDVGYFYNDFNLLEASSILDTVISDHDKQVSEYIEKNRKAIDRFLPTNEKLKRNYKILIDKLLNLNA